MGSVKRHYGVRRELMELIHRISSISSRLTPIILAGALAGCQGTVPSVRGDAKAGFGAILVAGRARTPSGETYRASMALNIESDDFHYVVPFTPGHATMYVVEPGKYRLGP